METCTAWHDPCRKISFNVAQAVKDRMEQVDSRRAGKGSDAFPVNAQTQGVCVTCQFWGGIRRVSVRVAGMLQQRQEQFLPVENDAENRADEFVEEMGSAMKP